MGIPEGGRLALMGPSGCGKTTLLRCLAGLLAPRGGAVTGRPEKVAFAFQEPRLLPWRTAAENVNLVLSDREETMPEALRWLSQMELDRAGGLYPGELSGGMQQRVSLARALAARPAFLALDEPFKAMDEALRQRVMHRAAEALKNTTLLLATHSADEAEALGCRVLRYEAGSFV
jgi:ABC-type nitrate/sulfonate/bicarbonate transport system ATPase subunit